MKSAKIVTYDGGSGHEEFVVRVEGETDTHLWWEGLNIECPEDLTWRREIEDLVRKAYTLGLRAGRGEIETLADWPTDRSCKNLDPTP